MWTSPAEPFDEQDHDFERGGGTGRRSQLSTTNGSIAVDSVAGFNATLRMTTSFCGERDHPADQCWCNLSTSGNVTMTATGQ